jgi:hypothetical protein
MPGEKKSLAWRDNRLHESGLKRSGLVAASKSNLTTEKKDSSSILKPLNASLHPSFRAEQECIEKLVRAVAIPKVLLETLPRQLDSGLHIPNRIWWMPRSSLVNGALTSNVQT